MKRSRYQPPRRYYRWLWLIYGLRAVTMPLTLVVAALDLTGMALHAGAMWYGGLLNRVHVACLNRDRERARGAGWKP